MRLNEAVAMRNVKKELPFLALEKAMMLLTEKNVSRQEAHQKIREVSINAQKKKCEGLEISFDEMISDSYFDLVCLIQKNLDNPMQTTV